MICCARRSLGSSTRNQVRANYYAKPRREPSAAREEHPPLTQPHSPFLPASCLRRFNAGLYATTALGGAAAYVAATRARLPLSLRLASSGLVVVAARYVSWKHGVRLPHLPSRKEVGSLEVAATAPVGEANAELPGDRSQQRRIAHDQRITSR